MLEWGKSFQSLSILKSKGEPDASKGARPVREGLSVPTSGVWEATFMISEVLG